MFFNKKIIKYNGSSQTKFNVKKYIYIFFNINSFLNNKEWLYIVQKYQEESIHFDRIQFCYDLLAKLYKYLKLKRASIISNSLIFYHKYYIYTLCTNSHIFNKLNENNSNNIELACICLACFFISTKVSNNLMQIDFILDIIYKNNIIDIKENNDKIKMKDTVLNYETDILFTINFNLEHELPYNYIKNIWGELSNKVLEFINNNKNKQNNNININNKILNNGDESNIIKYIKENIAEILNLSFLFPLFLFYNSTIIGLSCLIIAFKKLNININIIDIISNHKEMEYISIGDIDICSSLIDKFILSKIKKINNEENINNINNIHNINIQHLLNINHNTESNNETKLRINNNQIKNEMIITNNKK